MILATLTNKIKQEITLWFSSTHEKKVHNLLIPLPKLKVGHSRFIGTTIQIKVENNSHQTPSPNTIPM
jgi:hypothetical protein